MRSTRWPSLTLLALVAATGGVHAQPAAPADASQAAGSPPNAADAQETERRWMLPPLRLSGALSYDMRALRAQGAANSIEHLVTANVGASTYIYQPWLARVSGTLGLTTGWSSSTLDSVSVVGGGDASLHERIRTRQRFVTGTGRIDVFPQSRFPFEAHVERTDSRTDSGLASNLEFQTRNFGFSQRYRPVSGRFTLAGSFDHREQSGVGFRSTSDAINGDFNTRWKFNDLGVALSHSRAHTVGGEDQSRFSSLVATHTYTPSSALSLNSTVNWSRTEDQGLLNSNDIAVLQGTSIGIWRREGSPLTLTASARALALREDVAGTGLDTAGLTLGANYEVNRNLRLTATGGVNTAHTLGSGDSVGSSGTGLSATVGASYQGDTREFGATRYDWFTSGTAGTNVNQRSGLETERQDTLNMQVGHVLSRPFKLGPGSVLTLSGNQSLGWTQSRSNIDSSLGDLGSSRMLVNGLSAAWQAGTGQKIAYARASFNDSMELGGRHARFQLFNFQLSGNMDLGPYSSLGGDLTYQRSAQRSGDVFDVDHVLTGTQTRTSGASAELSYRNQRLFGVPRLRFVSRVKLAQDVLRQPGSFVSLPDRETRLWENRLDYSIGRIDAQLVLRLSEVDGRRLQSLTLRIQRTFGD